MPQLNTRRRAQCAGLLAVLLAVPASVSVGVGQAPGRILDLTHDGAVFGEARQYRVFLPSDYDAAPAKRYPVIYFFHGWSERHNRPPNTGRGYDAGDDYGGDNIASFVASHDVIVVKWDGFNPRTPGEDAYRRIRWEPDPRTQAIISSWPRALAAPRAASLGFGRDSGIDEAIQAFIEDDLALQRELAG